MNKKAFTLVELIGVITVIGLISILVAPTIINQIKNNQNKIDSVTERLIFSATDLYLDTKQNDYPKNSGSVYCLTLQDLVDDGKLVEPILNSNGDKISLDRVVKIDVVNNNYSYSVNAICENKVAITDFILSNDKITVEKNASVPLNVTVIPSNSSVTAINWSSSNESIATVDNSGVITGVSEGDAIITATTTDGSNITKTIEVNVIDRTISALATTTTEVTSINECATSGTCEPGTLFAIKVNETEIYNFYVTADDGSKLTLIMDRNLGDNVPWISAEDYAKANTDGTVCTEEACSDEGPITVISALKERTSGWTNIPEKEYTYKDDSGKNRYVSFTETMRARMLKYAGIYRLGCTSVDESCASWLYINLYNTGDTTLDSEGRNKVGYWTSSAAASGVNNAHNVSYYGHVGTGYVFYTGYGVRPVIELLK